jgi:hypothetical protein
MAAKLRALAAVAFVLLVGALTTSVVALIRVNRALHPILMQPVGPGGRVGSAYPYVDLTGNQTILANPPLGHAKGGTDVTSCGANNNVLTCSAGNWTSAAGATSFACSNLSSCSSGQLPVGGLAHGTAMQTLFTNQAGTASEWDTITGDLGSPSSCGGGVCTMTLLSLQGTALSLPGRTTGDVIQFNGAQWAHERVNVPHMVFPNGACANIPGTSAITQIATSTVTVPTNVQSLNAIIMAAFLIDAGTIVTGFFMHVGIGFNSPSSYDSATPVSPILGGGATGHAYTNLDVWDSIQPNSPGTETFYALADSTNAVTVCGQILVVWTY